MKLLKYIIWGLILGGTFACQEERVLDFIDQENEILVVEGLLTNEKKAHHVRLSLSSSYYDSDRGPAASGAVVFINNTPLQASTHPDSLGFYYTPADFQGVVGETYRLSIDYDGKSYFAVGKMNPVPEIDSIRIKRNPDIPDFVEIDLFDVDIFYLEDQSRKDYYAFDLYYDGELVTESINEKAFFEDDFLNEGPVSFTAQQFFSPDIEITGPAQVVLEMRSLTNENFKFYQDFTFQTEGSTNPFFAPPPANISTNLEGGAVGFFEVNAVARDSILFIPSDFGL